MSSQYSAKKRCANVAHGVDTRSRIADFRQGADETIAGSTQICIPAAMMMEMTRTHNSMAVKRGYLIFIIIMVFLMHHDRNFIRYFCLYRYHH
jgi:hypothetical protein